MVTMLTDQIQKYKSTRSNIEMRELEDTFEALLKNELKTMRENFEKQVSTLKSDLEECQRTKVIEGANLKKKIEDLEQSKEMMSNRLVALKKSIDSIKY